MRSLEVSEANSEKNSISINYFLFVLKRNLYFNFIEILFKHKVRRGYSNFPYWESWILMTLDQVIQLIFDDFLI